MSEVKHTACIKPGAVTHKVSVQTPFTVGSLCDFAHELSGLSCDREVTLTVYAGALEYRYQTCEDEQEVYGKLEVEYP